MFHYFNLCVILSAEYPRKMMTIIIDSLFKKKITKFTLMLTAKVDFL